MSPGAIDITAITAAARACYETHHQTLYPAPVPPWDSLTVLEQEGWCAGALAAVTVAQEIAWAQAREFLAKEGG